MLFKSTVEVIETISTLYTTPQPGLRKYHFLTIDYNFIDFLREHGYKLKGVVFTPKTLENLLER